MNTRRIAFFLLLAHIFSLLGFSTYAVSLKTLQSVWSLTNSEAGWIASGFFIGYVMAVSVWSSLTDHVDARRIYFAGSVIAALGSLGFGLFANNFVSALAFQILLGIGNAGTYMPGLKILSDRTEGRTQSRFVAFYTAFFGLGVAGSLFVSGAVLHRFGVGAAFVLCGLGPLIAAAMVLSETKPLAHEHRGVSTEATWARLFPFKIWREVLQNRECLGFTIGYGLHCAELFGSRAWIVAFLSFAFSSLDASSVLIAAPGAAAIVNIVSAPASIIGNEIALKVGRRRWINGVMPLTVLMGVLMGYLAGIPWVWMLLLSGIYSMLVMADSATLTAGLVAAADPKIRGTAMGLYSLIGFGLGGALGPAILGLTLDLTGGQGQAAHWSFAFGALGLGCLVFPLIDAWLHRPSSR